MRITAILPRRSILLFGLGSLTTIAVHAQGTISFKKEIISDKFLPGVLTLGASGEQTWLSGLRDSTAQRIFLSGMNACYEQEKVIQFGPKDARRFGAVSLTGSDKGVLVASANLYRAGPPNSEGVIMKFTSQADIEWSKIYCYEMRNIKMHPDGFIYFIGVAKVRDTFFSCIGKIDSAGHLVRARIIRNVNVWDIDILSDRNILISGQGIYSAPDTTSKNSIAVLKLDAYLNVLWYRRSQVLNGLEPAWNINVRGSKDMNVIVSFNLRDAGGSGFDGYRAIIKLDSGGNAVWSKKWAYTGPSNYYWNLETNADRTRFYSYFMTSPSTSNTIAIFDEAANVQYFEYPSIEWFGHKALLARGERELLFPGYEYQRRKYSLFKAEAGFAACEGTEKKFTLSGLAVANIVNPKPVIAMEDYFYESPVEMVTEKIAGKLELKDVCKTATLKRTIPKDTALCFGNNLKLDGGHPGAKRIWSTGDTAQVIEIPKSGTYWVHSVKGCFHSEDTVKVKFIEQTFVELGENRIICSEDSTFFEAIGTVPGLTYQWTIPKKDSTGQLVKIKGNTLCAKDSGMYTVRVADAGGCLDLDTVHLFFHPLPQPDAGADTAICYGSTIEMKGKGGITYLWTPADYLDNAKISNPNASPPDTQKYVLTISDTNGCKAHDTVWLNVKPPLELKLSQKAITACQGNTVTFTAISAGGQAGQRKVEWQKEGDTTWIPGISASWKADSSYSIIVRVNDGCSNEYRDFVHVVAIDTPSPVLSVVPVSGCEPLTVQCKAEGDTADLIFHWDMGDDKQYHQLAPVHTYLKAGKYKVVASLTDKASGCRSKIILPDEIEVLENPRAIMEIEPEITDLFHPEITFRSSSKNAAAIGWEMSGIRLSDKTPYTHTFADTGSFIMKLIAYHKNGCTDTALGTVYIKEPFVVYLPNTFTPNRDGLNEPFRPVLMGIADAPMQIYNRWGERVFEGDALKGWDGSFKGNPCSEGVYLYMIQVKGRESERDYYSGTVTLLR